MPTPPPLVVLRISGKPEPQGSKTAGRTKTGATYLREDNPAVKPWRRHIATVAARAVAALPDLPVNGPVVLGLVFTLRRPPSAPARVRWPAVRPDLDKLARAVGDALTAAGAWDDDARVVAYDRLAKVYPGTDPDALPGPGVTIRLWRAEDYFDADARLL